MSAEPNYTPDLLEQIFGCTAFRGEGYQEQCVLKILTDSRRLGNTDYALFIALKGPSHNGHQYIREAYEAGVRNFLVSEKVDLPTHDICLYEVKNTLSALQDLARYHRKSFPLLKSLAITGSNGKTMVKDWLYQLLSPDFSLVKSPKSYNSQVGVAKSLWQIGPQHRIGLFEAGISTTGEMENLEKMLLPEIGVYTHIGPAHDSGFNSWEEKVKEKFKLFKHCKTLIAYADHPLVQAELAKFEGKKITISNTDSKADFFLKPSADFEQLEMHHQGERDVFPLPFQDAISIQNLSIALVCALHLGADKNSLKDRLYSLNPVKMRLEYKEGRDGITLINDSYNSDPEALRLALEALKKYRSDSPKWLILSDFVQSREDRKILYSQVSQWIKEFGISTFIGVGEEICSYKTLFPSESEFHVSTSNLIHSLQKSDLRGPATLLLKGARSFAFEQIEAHFLQKTHHTKLEINLSAIEHNLGYLRSHLAPKTKIMAMVKAFSYGAGSVEMARFLEYQKVDYLSVAYTDEGVLLRKAGISTPIMVLNVHSGNFAQLAEYRLEPEIFSHRLLTEYLRFVQSQPNENFRYHLKIETGMHRLGFDLEELKLALPLLAAQKNVELASAFSHLADAENATGKDFSKLQITRFKEACALIDEYLPQEYLRHIHNSSGTLHHYESYFHMVRLGIALFGHSENARHRALMKPALALKTHISQIKNLKKGEYVGYGLAFEAHKDMRTATLAIGYADGLPRSLSLGIGKVFLQGKACPIIGKVCMDMCMIQLPEGMGQEGDEVEIFGEAQSLETFAQASQTIPYEALTRISERVLRVYYRE